MLFQLFASMMIGLRSLGYAAGALEVVSDSQGAAFGIYEIVEAVSKDRCAYIIYTQFISPNKLAAVKRKNMTYLNLKYDVLEVPDYSV